MKTPKFGYGRFLHLALLSVRSLLFCLLYICLVLSPGPFPSVHSCVSLCSLGRCLLCCVCVCFVSFLPLLFSLIKHLESLVVNYDYTVRDTDGSVIQFNYGEDSIDVCKSSYLDRFSFLTTNYKALVHKLNPASGLNKLDIHTADAYLNGELTQQPAAPAAAGSKKKGKHAAVAAPAKPEVLDPVLSLYNPGRFLGSLSEKYAESMDEYIARDPDGMVRDDCIACTHTPPRNSCFSLLFSSPPPSSLSLSLSLSQPRLFSRIGWCPLDGADSEIRTRKIPLPLSSLSSPLSLRSAPRASCGNVVSDCVLCCLFVFLFSSRFFFSSLTATAP